MWENATVSCTSLAAEKVIDGLVRQKGRTTQGGWKQNQNFIDLLQHLTVQWCEFGMDSIPPDNQSLSHCGGMSWCHLSGGVKEEEQQHACSFLHFSSTTAHLYHHISVIHGHVLFCFGIFLCSEVHQVYKSRDGVHNPVTEINICELNKFVSETRLLFFKFSCCFFIYIYGREVTLRTSDGHWHGRTLEQLC